LQAESQQTPSTQKPDAHWFPAEHERPAAARTWHVPPSQNPAASHSASTAHVNEHPAIAVHVPGAHAVPARSVRQAPSPSQVRPLAVPASQSTPPPHAAPLGKSAQVPALPHTPLLPQVLGSSAAHRSPGSLPAFAAPQVPDASPLTLLAAEHAWHAPSHAELQHTPSAQRSPAAHCSVRAQPSPCVRAFWQNVPSQ
jgi:hypothetical protein